RDRAARRRNGISALGGRPLDSVDGVRGDGGDLAVGAAVDVQPRALNADGCVGLDLELAAEQGLPGLLEVDVGLGPVLAVLRHAPILDRELARMGGYVTRPEVPSPPRSRLGTWGCGPSRPWPTC